MYLLHAIAEAGYPRCIPAVPRLRGQPLRWLPTGRLGVWATELVEPIGTRSEWRAEDLAVHHAIVTAIWESGACLPVRFGTAAEDELAVGRLIGGRGAELLTALERVRGRAELAITLVYEHEGEDQAEEVDSGEQLRHAGVGRRYLEARRRRWAARDRGTALAGQARVDLGVAESDALVTPTPRAGVAASLAVLVPLVDAATIHERALHLELPGARLLVNGPWPPYSFVTAGE